MYKVTSALGDLWGVTTKIIVHWSEVKILKSDGWPKEKGCA